MKRNNSLGTPQATPMPDNYTGGPMDYKMLRLIDGHAPMTDDDMGDAPMLSEASRNCHYPGAPDHEYPVAGSDPEYIDD